MEAVLGLISYLLDRFIPPAGGPQEHIDARFADIVANFETSS